MAEVAEVLRLAPSEVQAVSTFYSMYFDKPAGDHHVVICTNVSCALRGADEIVAHVERRLGARRVAPPPTASSPGRAPSSASAPAAARRRCRWTTTSTRTSPPSASTGSSSGCGRGRGAHARRLSAAPAERPHPPTAETPPAGHAPRGRPSEDEPGRRGRRRPARAPPVEHTEMPGSRTDPDRQPARQPQQASTATASRRGRSVGSRGHGRTQAAHQGLRHRGSADARRVRAARRLPGAPRGVPQVHAGDAGRGGEGERAAGEGRGRASPPG